ncbi:MAG: hypothetical protein ACE5IZ_10365, partial [Dehalococcoidia bacterium]
DAEAVAAVEAEATLDIQGQVAFPATQSASANANTLDDYEEGTWTPAITFGGNAVGVTYSGQEARYTKIGRLVTIDCQMTLSSKGSSTGAALITGLPFTVGANHCLLPFGAMSVSFADTRWAYAQAGATTVRLMETTNAGVNTDLDDTDFADACSAWLGATYSV